MKNKLFPVRLSSPWRIPGPVLLGVLTVGLAASCCLEARATMYQVTSIADLEALTGMSDGDIAFVTRYYATYDVGDRGGGKFLWRASDTTAPDGGRFIEANSTGTGRWVRMLEGQVANVKMWGAHGDHSTDDTVAIQNAVNGCDSIWSAELQFPACAGYMISNTIVFDAGLHIKGDGQGYSKVIMTGNHDVFRTKSANDALNTGIFANEFDPFMLFENIFLDAGTNSTTNAALVIAWGGEPTIVQNIHTSNGGIGIRLLGAGSPGVKVVNCAFTHHAIAGVTVEGGGGGPITLMSPTIDHDDETNVYSTASLLKITGTAAIVSVYDFWAEGEYGGGLFNYSWSMEPGYNPGPSDILGSLSIFGGVFNGGSSAAPPNDFVVLNSNGPRVPAVYIAPTTMQGVRYLIRDDKTGRTVKPDNQLGSGLDQTTTRLPVQYEGVAFCPTRTRLVVGDTVRYDLYPPTTGWYRILEGGLPAHMGGRVIISTAQECSEIGIDAVPIYDPTCMTLTVNRASRDNGWSYQPRVTQVRSGIYGVGGTDGIPFVDIYVASVPASWDPIKLAMPYEGNMLPGDSLAQLLTPTNAITSIIPMDGCEACTNCVVFTCTTNSLTH